MKRKLYLLVATLTAIALDYFFPGQGETIHATLIGALITGAGVTTSFTGRANCDEYIVIGGVGTANPLSGISVSVKSKGQTINIQGSQVTVTAFMKWTMQFVGTAVGNMLTIGTGRINESTDYKFTNAGATTPNIYASSSSKEGKPLFAAQVGINPSSNQDFRKFSALFITPLANIASIDMEYADGHIESNLAALEVAAYLANQMPTDANGLYDATVLTIDNRPGLRENNLVRVKVYTNSTAGGATVTQANFDESDWNELKASGKVIV